MSNDPAYQSRYRKNNAEKLKAYHRERRTGTYGAPATLEEQHACTADPRKSLRSEFGVVSEKAVLCMLCWRRYQDVARHLLSCPKRPDEWSGSFATAYKSRFGLNRHTSLRCEELQERHRKRPASKRLGEIASTRKGDPRWKEHLAEIRNNTPPTRALEVRLDIAQHSQGDADPARQKVSHVTVVKLFLLEGLLPYEIAEKTRLNHAAVIAALERVFGFRGACQIAHGEPLTGRWAKDFLDRFSLNAHHLQRARGIASGWFSQATSAERLDRPLKADKAALLVDLERALLRQLLLIPEFRDRDVFKTTCPNLSNSYQRLTEAMIAVPALRGDQPEDSWIDSILQVEIAAGTDHRFRTMLFWLPRFLDFTRSKKDWRDRWPSPSDLAIAVLAFDYGTSEWTIREAISQRATVIASDTLRSASTSRLKDLPKRGGHVPGKMSEGTRLRIRLSAALDVVKVPEKDQAVRLFPRQNDKAARLSSLYTFRHRYKRLIQLSKLGMTSQLAEKIVSSSRLS